MKKFKKIFAVLLTLAMVLGMSMTSFAAGNWTISVTGTGIDQAIVKYGQIIKADQTSTLGWTFVSPEVATNFTSGWNSAKEVGSQDLTADQVIEAMIAAEMIENPANAHVSSGTINPSAQLSAALARVTDVATSNMNDGIANVQQTGCGLYIIVAQRSGYDYLPMAAYMNTTGTDVVVTAKGSENQVNKTVAEEGKSVAPGDKVQYTIEEQYLYFEPHATNKTFTITDKLTNGTIDFDTNIEILLDNEHLIRNDDYTLEYDETSFTVSFKYKPDYAGKTVKITYTAIAGDVTTNKPLSNQVSSSNGTGKIVEVKPVSFTVVKVDADNVSKTLEGAEFQIYKMVEQDAKGAVQLTLADESKVYGVPVGDPIVTNEKGEATINNLDAQGTYYVKETKAPEGYSLNDTAYQLTGATQKNDVTETETIDGVDYEHVTHSFNNFDLQTVRDTTLSSLPSTGGIGTTIFTIGGCAIMLIAAALFFANRRKTSK